MIGSYFLGLLPKIDRYLPTKLTDGVSLIYGLETADGYLAAVVITVVLVLISLALSIPLMNRKQM